MLRVGTFSPVVDLSKQLQLKEKRKCSPDASVYRTYCINQIVGCPFGGSEERFGEFTFPPQAMGRELRRSLLGERTVARLAV